MTKQTLPDRLISWLDPVAAMRRRQARAVLAYYEAAKPDRTRKGRRETGSGNDAVLRAGSSLRQQARHLEQNYDLAAGVLNVLVANIVGQHGIGVEPQPRRVDGTIHEEFAREIMDLRKDWAKRPEVTWQHDLPSCERILCRSWLRDGDVFAQQLLGSVPYLDHGTKIPYSIEMLEMDYVPMDLNSNGTPTIRQGVEINAWGRPVAYHVHRTDPNEATFALAGKTKRIGAADMLHLAVRTRIRQLRGVSVFASVMTRFDNLKDYEESERIAAMIAASMAAYIKKGTPDQYDPEQDEPRHLKFRAGMVFDDLKPGEEIGTIDTSRPNPNLELYRNGQMKGIAAGTGPTFSSISKTYDGTYSAQRQELVEGYSAYGILASEFIGRITRPVHESMIAAAIASGKLRVPPDVVFDTVDDAIYIPPQMPWIDPAKEATAFETLERNHHISGPEIIRKRGASPMEVLQQAERWMREKARLGLNDSKDGKPAKKDSEDEQAVASLLSELNSLAERLDGTRALYASGTASAPVVEVHNHLPEQVVPVSNHTTEIHNHLPEQAAPVVDVKVEAIMPEQAAPVVDVKVEAIMPEQAAPVVNVTNEVQPAAIRKIEIIAMPDRETTSTVERDSGNNIIKTTQKEVDA